MDTTLLKGLAALDALVRSDRGLSVSELASELNIQRSNAHRTLATLVESGYATSVLNAGEPIRYRGSLKLWELGNLVVRSLDIREAARASLEQLSRETGETIVLGVLDGLETIYLEKIDAKQSTGINTYVGARAPALCTAIGQVMLAFAAPAVLEQIPAGLPRHTPRTITVKEQLLRKLELIREQGFALNQGEWREDISGVAVPVFGPHGAVLAGISVSGPSARLGLKALRALRPFAERAGYDVTMRIGGSSPLKPSARSVPPKRK